LLLTYKENVHSTQMYIPLKPLFSRHKGIGVQFTDEPTGNLDFQTELEVMSLLKSCVSDFGQTLIMITHDETIAQMADEMIIIEDGKAVRR
jgi:ABC-type lipoprotein export system ATPase subunit